MYQDKWEALSLRTRKVLQVAAGVLIAALTGFFIFRSGSEEGGMWGTFAAAAVAIFLPRILEAQTGDKLSLMRRTLLIGLVIVVVVTLVVAFRGGL